MDFFITHFVRLCGLNFKLVVRNHSYRILLLQLRVNETGKEDNVTKV